MSLGMAHQLCQDDPTLPCPLRKKRPERPTPYFLTFISPADFFSPEKPSFQQRPLRPSRNPRLSGPKSCPKLRVISNHGLGQFAQQRSAAAQKSESNSHG